jgi:glycosyltransferase involved in cell wall biosynthesis
MDLSILIPARNEEFLAKTIEDILSHIEADTEVIAVLDGEWAKPGIPQHERVNVIYVPKAIGQRAAQNIACRLARGKYVMKVDAHCAFDKGFDRKMIEMFRETGDDVTAIPLMRNLIAFNWKCYGCGKKWYQDVSINKCDVCGSEKIRRKMIWEPRRGTRSTSYAFNPTPQFQYFNEFKQRPEGQGDITESMSVQGSCFMCTRDNYWKKELCDENLGNWGNQGIEVACKTWLSGGRVLVNHKTWYAHLFRTKSNFGFPWPVSGKDQNEVKKRVADLLFNNKWDKAIHPISWLVKRFYPVPGWSDEDIKKLENYDNAGKKAE